MVALSVKCIECELVLVRMTEMMFNRSEMLDAEEGLTKLVLASLCGRIPVDALSKSLEIAARHW